MSVHSVGDYRPFHVLKFNFRFGILLIKLFYVSFIEIAQIVDEIWCSQDLTSTACRELDF